KVAALQPGDQVIKAKGGLDLSRPVGGMKSEQSAGPRVRVSKRVSVNTPAPFDDLPEIVRDPDSTVRISSDTLSSDELSVKKRSAELEKHLISRALEVTEGNRTRAAELLDLSYRALLYKIRDYGLD
ncbi:MAG: helix-turn-helix domain-containing protein, partial [Gemmatimonadota bacterium]